MDSKAESTSKESTISDTDVDEAKTTKPPSNDIESQQPKRDNQSFLSGLIEHLKAWLICYCIYLAFLHLLHGDVFLDRWQDYVIPIVASSVVMTFLHGYLGLFRT
jgi:hypothetical protein